MPSSAPTICKCGYIKMSGEKCPRCSKQSGRDYNKYNRDEQATEFYQSARWKQVRELARNRDKGLCVMCLKENRITKLDVVDHILPREHYPEFAYSLDNLQCLCHLHHNKKTAEDKLKFKNF